jgi:hypothetical protein
MEYFLLGIGFTNNQINTCVQQTNVSFLFTSLYVDDIVLMNNHLT